MNLDIAELKNIMVIVPYRLGDAIFCTQLIRFLKGKNLNLSIDIIAPTQIAAEVFKCNPYVRTIYVLPSHTEIEKIKNIYTLVINLNNSEKNIFSKWFNPKYLVDYKDDYNLKQPAAEKMLQFFARIFDCDLLSFGRHYDLFASKENYAHINNLLQKNNVKPATEILIGFHLGCYSLAKKRPRIWNTLQHPRIWALKKFISLAKQLNKYNNNIHIVLTGTKAEQKLAKRFQKKYPGVINLIDQTGVNELFALMEHLKLFISNDTGALHVASSSNVNLIALFGSSDPRITGPYPMTPNKVVLHKPDINDISVAEVLESILRLLLNVPTS